ncbi:hypothetical protein RB598_002361 [Gaeumannomyces tritici]
MSFNIFKCWRRDRKQAAAGPAHCPQLDDSVIVPVSGFLSGPVMLPTYESLGSLSERMDRYEKQTLRTYISLTTSEVLNTMRRGALLARCVLFETARLHKPISFVGALRLRDDARILDVELADLCEVLAKGNMLILCPLNWVDESVILQREPVRGVLRTAKKSLLELEKTFNDQVLGELKNGMQGKESVDHKKLVAKVGNMKEELDKVYGEITTAYKAVEYQPIESGITTHI